MSTKPGTGRQVNKKTKVRTGCITCKIRKVKCDEIKPSCKRCTDTGRKCDGYGPRPSKPNSSDHSASTALTQQRPKVAIPSRISSPSVYADVGSLSNMITGEERQWIEFFSVRTGPALSGVFDKTFWTHILPQMSCSEPAIRHALLAVGSLHAQFEANPVSLLQTPCGIGPNYTLRHYNKAIIHLQKSLAGAGDVIEVSLVCCLLFICLECLYGNRLLFLTHLHNGLQILKSGHFPEADGGDSLYTSSTKHNLRRIFRRLDAQSTLFGKPASVGFEGLEKIYSITIPVSFYDFDEAKRTLDVLIAASLDFVKSTFDGALSNDIGFESVSDLQLQLQNKLSKWKDVLEQMAKKRAPSADNRRQEKLLRVQHTATYVWVSTCLGDKETLYDAYLEQFRDIVGWAQELSVTPRAGEDFPTLTSKLNSLSVSNQSTFALDMSLIPPLFLTAIKCRDSVVRRQAIDLMEAIPGREGLWDAKLHGRVARRVVEIEESNTFIDPHARVVDVIEGDTSTKSRDRVRVRNSDIIKSNDDADRSLYVTFFTAPNALSKECKIWKEKLWF